MQGKFKLISKWGCAIAVWGAFVQLGAANDLTYQVTLINDAIYFSLNPRSGLNRNNRLLELPRLGDLLRLRPEVKYERPSGRFVLYVAPRYDAYLTSTGGIHKLFLDEGFVNVSLGNSTTLIAGRQKIDWGSGYAWNPFNVFNPPNRRQRDGFQREGVDQLKLQWRGDRLGLTGLVTTNQLLKHKGIKEKETRAAIKMDYLAKGYDVSLLLSRSDRDRGLLAATLTKVVGNSLELHSEVAIQDGSATALFVREARGVAPPLSLRLDLIPTKAASGNILARFLFGGQYTFKTNTNVVVEYFRNGTGYNQREWQQFTSAIRAANILKEIYEVRFAERSELNPFLGFLLLSNRYASHKGAELRRNYMFLRLAQTLQRERVEIDANSIINLDDRSFFLSASFKYKLKPRMNLIVYMEYYHGGGDSEFGNFYYKYNFRPALEWFF